MRLYRRKLNGDKLRVLGRFAARQEKDKNRGRREPSPKKETLEISWRILSGC